MFDTEQKSSRDYPSPNRWHVAPTWFMHWVMENGHRWAKKSGWQNRFPCVTLCLETLTWLQGFTVIDPWCCDRTHWSVLPHQRAAACWECGPLFAFLLTLRGAYGSQHKASTRLLSVLILPHSSAQRWTTGHSGMHEHTRGPENPTPLYLRPVPLVLILSFLDPLLSPRAAHSWRTDSQREVASQQGQGN